MLCGIQYKLQKYGNTPFCKGVDRMAGKKEKKIQKSDIPQMEPRERVKYEIAEELGLLDRVLEGGWKTLSSKETGRIGGMITKKRKEQEKN